MWVRPTTFLRPSRSNYTLPWRVTRRRLRCRVTVTCDVYRCHVTCPNLRTTVNRCCLYLSTVSGRIRNILRRSSIIGCRCLKRTSPCNVNVAAVTPARCGHSGRLHRAIPPRGGRLGRLDRCRERMSRTEKAHVPRLLAGNKRRCLQRTSRLTLPRHRGDMSALRI